MGPYPACVLHLLVARHLPVSRCLGPRPADHQPGCSQRHLDDLWTRGRPLFVARLPGATEGWRSAAPWSRCFRGRPVPSVVLSIWNLQQRARGSFRMPGRCCGHWCSSMPVELGLAVGAPKTLHRCRRWREQPYPAACARHRQPWQTRQWVQLCCRQPSRSQLREPEDWQPCEPGAKAARISREP